MLRFPVMETPPRLASATAALLLVALACNPDETVVATVGGRDVRVQEAQAYLTETSGITWQSIDERVASRLLDQYLDQEVMAGAVGRSRRREIPTEPAARSAAVRSLVAEVCGPAPLADETAVEMEVAKRMAEVRPARARVRQMLLRDRADAEAARQRVASGEDFVEVSRELSTAANAATGGELGVLTRGTLPEEIDEVVFSLEEGQLSEPVGSPAGFHVFQVLDIVPEGSASRPELEPVVRRALNDELARAHVRRCVDEHRASVGVTVYTDHLWFRYEGRYGIGSTTS